MSPKPHRSPATEDKCPDIRPRVVRTSELQNLIFPILEPSDKATPVSCPGPCPHTLPFLQEEIYVSLPPMCLRPHKGLTTVFGSSCCPETTSPPSLLACHPLVSRACPISENNFAFLFFPGAGGGWGRTRSCYGAQAVLEFEILLPQLPECSAYKPTPPCIAFTEFTVNLVC